jgi:hypothetical protein
MTDENSTLNRIETILDALLMDTPFIGHVDDKGHGNFKISIGVTDDTIGKTPDNEFKELTMKGRESKFSAKTTDEKIKQALTDVILDADNKAIMDMEEERMTLKRDIAQGLKERKEITESIQQIMQDSKIASELELNQIRKVIDEQQKTLEWYDDRAKKLLSKNEQLSIQIKGSKEEKECLKKDFEETKNSLLAEQRKIESGTKELLKQYSDVEELKQKLTKVSKERDDLKVKVEKYEKELPEEMIRAIGRVDETLSRHLQNNGGDSKELVKYMEDNDKLLMLRKLKKTKAIPISYDVQLLMKKDGKLTKDELLKLQFDSESLKQKLDKYSNLPDDDEQLESVRGEVVEKLKKAVTQIENKIKSEQFKSDISIPSKRRRGKTITTKEKLNILHSIKI